MDGSVFRVVRDYYDEYGCCLPLEDEKEVPSLPQPERLVWEMNPELEAAITRAISFNLKVNF